MIFHQGYMKPSQVVGWLKDLRGHPHVRISHYDVTAVYQVKQGEETYYVGGVNVENAVLQLGTCGEEGAQSAFAVIFGAGAAITQAWVMGADSDLETHDKAPTPCGECRQRLPHFAAGSVKVHKVSLDGEIRGHHIVRGLLPDGFSFNDLNPEAFVADQRAAVEPSLDNAVREGKTLMMRETFSWLQSLLTRADARATHTREAVVLKLTNGAYVAGVNVENAAFPASTLAMQGAVAIASAMFDHPKVSRAAYLRVKPEGNETAYSNIDPASLQVLAEFRARPDISVFRFNQQGGFAKSHLDALAPTATTTWQQGFR
ncbi:MAG: hypothetical protein J0L97_02490 [Alphaproteobacteria bacterium]|nr:hypothetical protein [Alphaproteobacteria bacterium]